MRFQPSAASDDDAGDLGRAGPLLSAARGMQARSQARAAQTRAMLFPGSARGASPSFAPGSGSLMATPRGRAAVAANLARLRGGQAAPGYPMPVVPGGATAGFRLPGGAGGYSAAQALEQQAQMTSAMSGFPYGVSALPGAEGAAQPNTTQQQNAAISTYYGQSRQTRQLSPLPLSGSETPSQIAGILSRMPMDADKRLTVEETTAVVLLFAAEAATAAGDAATAKNLSDLAGQWSALVQRAAQQQPAPVAQAPQQPQIIVVQQPAAPPPPPSMEIPMPEPATPGWVWVAGTFAAGAVGFLAYRALRKRKK